MSIQAAEQHAQAAAQYGHAAVITRQPPPTIRWVSTRKPRSMRRPRVRIMHRPRLMR